MADLTTLDPTLPADTDAASQGASRMREERNAIINSFGLEHTLAGVHTTVNGNTGSRPAPGHAGHIFINTERHSLEVDDGSVWNFLRSVNGFYARDTAVNAIPVGAATLLVANGTLQASKDGNFVFLGMVSLANGGAGAANVLISMGMGGLLVSTPNPSDSFNIASGQFSTFTCFGLLPAPVSAGAYNFGMTLGASGGSALTKTDSRLLVFAV